MKPTLLILTLGAVLTSLHAADAKRPVINPALLYWQSASQLPTLTTDQVTHLREIASGKKSVTPQQWKEMGFESAEKLLLRAAESTAPCDWGLPWELGPETPMPHVSKLVELANIAVGEAESQFTQGNLEQGQKWLLITHRVARHAGVDDALISYLVQCAIEQNALRCAARHCLAWNDEVRQGYQAKLKELPPMHSLQQAYRGETKLIDWLERLLTLSDTERKATTKMLFAMVDSSKDVHGAPSVQQSDITALEDPEKLRRAIAELREFEQKTYIILGKPWKVATTELSALAGASKNSDSILVRVMLPIDTSILHKASATDTLQTMLNAGLQYGAQLDAAHAGEFHDAFEGATLQFKKDSDGSMTLQSATVLPNGKITELRFAK